MGVLPEPRALQQGKGAPLTEIWLTAGDVERWEQDMRSGTRWPESIADVRDFSDSVAAALEAYSDRLAELAEGEDPCAECAELLRELEQRMRLWRLVMYQYTP